MTLPRQIIIKGHRIRMVWIGVLLVALYYSVLFLNLPGGLPAFPPAVEEPIRTLQAKVLSNPDDSLAVLRLGEAFKLKGNIAVAKPLLERALRLDPALDHARFMLAEIHRDEGKLWAAYREFSQVYSRHPNDMGPALKAAECCRERGDSQEAERLYLEVVAKKPDTTLAYYWLGLIRLQNNDFQAAAGFLEKTLKLDPSFSDARTRLQSLKSEPWPDVDLRLMRSHWWKIVLPLGVALVLRLIVWRGVIRVPSWFLCKEVYIHVYLICLSSLLFAHYMKITKDPALHGEELAAAYRNVVYLEQHLQSDYMATNFSGTMFYWLGSHLFPCSTQSQRLFKISVVALLPCLLMALARRIRPETSLGALLFGAVVFILIPSVSWLSITAIECCADVVFSLLMLLLAFTAGRDGWKWRDWVCVIAIGALMVWVAHFYGASLVVLPVTAMIVLMRALIGVELRRPDSWWRFFGLSAVGLMVLVVTFWPYLYFGTIKLSMFSGGGKCEWSPSMIMRNLSVVFGDLFVKTDSYMLAGDILPAAFPFLWQGVVLLALATVGVVYTIRTKRAEGLSCVAIIVLSVVLSGVASSYPGIRRIIPAVVMFVVMAVVGFDVLWSKAGHPVRSVFFSRLAMTAVAVGIVVMSCRSWIGAYTYVHTHYRTWLQREFVDLAGMDYQQTVETLVARLQKSKITIGHHDYHKDVVVMLRLICQRRGGGYVPPYYDGEWDSRLHEEEFISRIPK